MALGAQQANLVMALLKVDERARTRGRDGLETAQAMKWWKPCITIRWSGGDTCCVYPGTEQAGSGAEQLWRNCKPGKNYGRNKLTDYHRN